MRGQLTGRLPFRCRVCGLLLAGRWNSRGEVVAYDRGPTADIPPLPCVCVSCGDREEQPQPAR